MKKLDASPFGEFRREIMGAIKPSMYLCLFSVAGRPSCLVDVLLGVMILSCFLGVSEDSILAQLRGNIYYQYALCLETIPYAIPSKSQVLFSSAEHE